MITGIKQKAIVGHNGKIEIVTSELPEGAIVEILILWMHQKPLPILAF